jgi:hypothetical protein
MAKIKAPKILYFIDGPVPNQRNRQEALAFTAKGATVVFRNARFATKDDVSVEENTAAVLGDEKIIPDIYKKANLLSPDAAIAKYTEAMDKEANAASGVNNDGEQDNMGTHTLPNKNQTPVRAQSREDDGKTQQFTTPQPVQPGAGEVASAPSPRPGAGPADPVVPGTPVPVAQPIPTGTTLPAPGGAATSAPAFGAAPTPTFDPANPPKQ